MAKHMCEHCSKLDDEEKMVYCLGCRKWFHKTRECTSAEPGLPAYRMCPWCGFLLYQETGS